VSRTSIRSEREALMASVPTEPTIPAEPGRHRAGRREPLLVRALRKGWYALGPGFITGASDDDPSGIATYSQTGAHFGYALLWTAVWQLRCCTTRRRP
jgi:hypothetical protein